MKGKASNSAFKLKGRGILQGLVTESSETPENIGDANTRWVKVEQIKPNPNQPRQYFSQESLDQLADSFKTRGFKGAINVRALSAESFQIVAGERRWRAAQQAGLDKVRCIIDTFTDEEALQFALVENLQREDLSKLEETEGILQLIEVRLGILSDQAVQTIRSEGHPDKISRSDVAPGEQLGQIIRVLSEFGIELQTFRTKNLRTLSLPEELKLAHLQKGLPYSSALEINKLKNAALREQVLDEVLAQNLSFRQTKALVKSRIQEEKPAQPRPAVQAKLIERITKTLTSTQQANHILSKPQKRKELEALLTQIEELIQKE